MRKKKIDLDNLTVEEETAIAEYADEVGDHDLDEETMITIVEELRGYTSSETAFLKRAHRRSK